MASTMHIHIGGAGVKIGDSLWRLYEKEKPDVQNLSNIYTEDSKGNHSPNVLFADLNNQYIDEVKRKKQINFRDKSFVKGKEDAADNWCRGFYTVGKEIIEQSYDSIRKQIEGMDYFEQFIITQSVNGGTGSGFGPLLLYRLSDDYRKKQKYVFSIYPSQNQSNTIVEAYNSLFNTNSTMDHCDSVILFDNESIYNILDQYLELDFVDYNHLNNIVSQVISSYTGLQRFSGISNTKVLNNLVPQPTLHYIVPSYGPLSSINDYQMKDLNESNILKQIVNKNSKLYQIKDDPIHLSCTLINRQQKQNEFYGQHCTPLQNLQNIHNYYKTPAKVYQCKAKNYQIIPELKELKQTNTFLSNDATVKNRFQALLRKFSIIYHKRAYVHWYVGEGMEELEFNECIRHIQALIQDYEDCLQGHNQQENQQE